MEIMRLSLDFNKDWCWKALQINRPFISENVAYLEVYNIDD